jgi:RAB protein geranylgeranyltransferase component A
LNGSLKFGKSTEILDNILSFQRHHSSRQVLATRKNKIPMREMQALRSQIHHKRKMKKSLKSVPIFSKDPLIMKETTRKEMMTNINMIILTRMS